MSLNNHLHGKKGELNPLFGRKFPETSKRMMGEGNPNYGKSPSEKSKLLWRNSATVRYDIQLPSGEIIIKITAKEISKKFNISYEYIVRKFKRKLPCKGLICINSYRLKNI